MTAKLMTLCNCNGMSLLAVKCKGELQLSSLQPQD